MTHWTALLALMAASFLGALIAASLFVWLLIPTSVPGLVQTIPFGVAGGLWAAAWTAVIPFDEED